EYLDAFAESHRPYGGRDRRRNPLSARRGRRQNVVPERCCGRRYTPTCVSAPYHATSLFQAGTAGRAVARDARGSALLGLDVGRPTTLPHYTATSVMSLPKTAGEPASAASPKSASRAFILGSARAAFISLFSLSIILGGVLFGAATPNQLLASKPG